MSKTAKTPFEADQELAQSFFRKSNDLAVAVQNARESAWSLTNRTNAIVFCDITPDPQQTSARLARLLDEAIHLAAQIEREQQELMGSVNFEVPPRKQVD